MRYGARTDMAWFGKFPAGVSGFEIPGKCRLDRDWDIVILTDIPSLKPCP